MKPGPDDEFLSTVLEEYVGLSPYEVDVYLALLREGRQTMTELAASSGVPQQRIYDVVETLSDREFVETVNRHPAEAYAVDPRNVIQPIRDRLEMTEHSLEYLYQKMDEVSKSIKVVTETSSMRRYLLRTIESAQVSLIVVVPYKKRDLIADIAIPEGVHAELFVSNLPKRFVFDDHVEIAGTFSAQFDEIKGITSNEPVIVLADREQCFLYFGSTTRATDPDPIGLFITNIEVASLIDRSIIETLSVIALPQAETTNTTAVLAFPAEYIRLRDCLSDIHRATRNRSIESFEITVYGHEADTQEQTEIKGLLIDYNYDEYDSNAYFELDTGDRVVTVGGWKSTQCDFEARRITVRDRSADATTSGLEATTTRYLRECRDAFTTPIESQPIVIGFDGAVDRMRTFIEYREGSDTYTPMSEFSAVKDRFVTADATTRSPGFEWVETNREPGGHTRYAGEVFRDVGHDLSIIGALGHPPVAEFSDAFPNAALVPICDPSTTDYVQFDSGKILLNDREELAKLDYDALAEHISVEKLITLFDGAAVLSIAELGSIPALPEILKELLTDIWPRLTEPPTQIMLMSGDIQRLPNRELPAMIATLDTVDDIVPITLFTTRSQAMYFGRVFESAQTNSISRIASTVHDKLSISRFVVHTPYEAAVSSEEGTITAQGHRHELTYQSGNAEDHFASGFTVGQLEGLSDGASLVLGNAVASFHNQYDASPTPAQLQEYLTVYDSTKEL